MTERRRENDVPRAVSLIARFGGIGDAYLMPGTWASLATVPLAWLIWAVGGSYALLGVALGVTVLGIWVCDVYARSTERPDPQEVVIDEVAGMLLAAWFVAAAGVVELVTLMLAFLFFRLFDIAKVWPANWAEKRLPGGYGIMLDDIVAALYAGALSFVITRLFFIPGGL
jgi:phosphatidylglycerophosphatase A